MEEKYKESKEMNSLWIPVFAGCPKQIIGFICESNMKMYRHKKDFLYKLSGED